MTKQTENDLNEGLRIMRERLGNSDYDQRRLREDIAANEAVLGERPE